MSQARGFGLNGKSIYANVAKLMLVQCNFVVDHTNGSGLGIRSLKSNGYIENVFMNTTATPGVNNGFTNPNPIAGYALIQFKNNFNKYLGGTFSFVSPLSGTYLTSVTAGHAYTIVNAGAALGYKFTVSSGNATQGATYTNSGVTYTVLATISSGTTLYTSGASAPAASGTLTKASGTGDSTLTYSAFTLQGATTPAQWNTAGLPAGLTPTVGQSFISLATAQIGGSGQVMAQSTSGILSAEVVGDPNQSIANSSVITNGGAQILVQFLNGSAALTAPADTSECAMSFWFDGSTVTVDGI